MKLKMVNFGSILVRSIGFWWLLLKQVLIGSMPLLNSQVVFMPLQKLKLCLCHSQFSIPPSMPFSTIQHENGSINSRISVYTFVLTKIILCSDLERLLGVSGAQKIQNFQILAKIRTSQENLFFIGNQKHWNEYTVLIWATYVQICIKRLTFSVLSRNW